MIPIAAAAAALALASSWLLTRAFVRGVGPALMDHPNDRSLHEVPVRRTGGLAIVAGVIAGHAVLAGAGLAVPGLGALAVCTALVLVVSVLDDIRHVSPLLRLGVHVAASAGLVAAGIGLSRIAVPSLELVLPVPLDWLVSVLLVTWMVNLYNFMDGMDGFAGGMGVVGFAAMAVLTLRGGSPALAASCLIIAVACAGFLPWNLHPARIFMGDAGASVLGFLAGVVGLQADRSGVVPLWLTLLVFSPFIVDATMTLARRALAMERVWQAHRSHFYQRLVRLGWGHRRTTRWEYVLMIGCAATAIAVHGRSSQVQAAALIGWAIAYTVLMLSVTLLERQGRAR